MNRIAILEGYESPFGRHVPRRRRPGSRRRPMREWVYTNPTESKKTRKWKGKWKLSKSKKAVKARGKFKKCAKSCSRGSKGSRGHGKFQPCMKKCLRKRSRK